MLKKILQFELNARFKQPITLLFFLMLVFQGVWYTQGSYEHYVSDSTLMNGSALFYRNFAGGGMLLIIVIAIITGTLLYKDIQYKSAGFLYALPMNEKQFFLGRFIAAFLINVIISTGFFVGMLLTPYSGIAGPEKFGPMPWGQMFHGFFLLTTVNLFMLTMICFSMLVFFKKMAAGYLSIFGVVMFFLIAEATRENASDPFIYELMDPFTYVYTAHQMDALPAALKNTGYLQFNTTFFLNRLLWVGGSLILFILAYRRFSFKQFITENAKKKSQLVDDTSNSGLKLSIPGVRLDFTSLEFIRKFWRLSVLEFNNVVRPVNFKIILGIFALMFFLQNVMWNATYYLGPTEPLTSVMTFVRLPNGFFIMIILMIWAGELFFKDKVSNIWQITDALPVPIWVTQFSKFVAMCGIALIMALVIMACGIVAQVLMGGWQEIDLLRYADDLLGYKWGWLTFVMHIALVFFVSGLTGNRFLTHILCVGYYLFNIISFDQGIMEEVRFGFALVPGVEDYSELNGYGIWKTASFWFFLMWTCFTVVLVLLGIHFWRRGTSLNFMRKLTFRTNQLNLSGKGVALLSLIAFFFLQSFIVREVNDKGNFETETEEKMSDAAYEKKYKWIEPIPQPKLTSLNVDLDIYPAERKAVYEAEMQLSNRAGIYIDTLYLHFEDFVVFDQIQWNKQSVAIAWIDEALGQLALPVKIDSAETGTLSISAKKQYVGFTQSGESPQPDLTFNGTFMNAKDILPGIGYHSDRELDQNRDRQFHNLEKITSRMAGTQDSEARLEGYFTAYAESIKGTVTISTSVDQMAIAPGKLVRSDEENGRRSYEYNIVDASPYEWYFGSARYEKQSFSEAGLASHFFYKSSHHYNIELFQKVVKNTHQFISEKLGPYPFEELRVVEIPSYQEDNYGFANSIAIAETEGWYVDASGLPEKAYITFSIATQMISHWIHQNVQVANVQGADMLTKALPQALALQVVKSAHGERAVTGLLDKKKSFYGKERGNEPNQEPPLIYADGIDYLEGNKGTMAMYDLSLTIGLGNFYGKLKSWISENENNHVIFEDLYRSLTANLNQSQKTKAANDFEKVAMP
ncbi:hypothetical protein FNH22_19650 [Fulvivirga sp. M361]|uniref:ABC transporter permease/M1 family aminopeptidase n=1 Tax=Fulvivirga sp. M361 TaxID=2594266 RepID=UPI00117BB426|nr:hypothetical protein [Fulvivirga sp. M361]TRX54332.1 hypothetical protein FNH22_19650 [Fulvivirga sp. M361]